MQNISRRRSRRAILRLLAAAIVVALALLMPVSCAVAQTPASVTWLGDLYARVQRSNPRIDAAQQLVRAALARVPGAKRPPDPQLQLGFMNYTLPGLAPMPTLGMTQLQLMQMLPLGGKLHSAGIAPDAQASAT